MQGSAHQIISRDSHSNFLHLLIGPNKSKQIQIKTLNKGGQNIHTKRNTITKQTAKPKQTQNLFKHPKCTCWCPGLSSMESCSQSLWAESIDGTQKFAVGLSFGDGEGKTPCSTISLAYAWLRQGLRMAWNFSSSISICWGQTYSVCS